MFGRKEAFSLVEIVLALGVIAFALIAIMGLFPVAMGAAKDSATETHAAMIAQLIVGQIRSLPPSAAALAVGPTPTNSTGSLSLRLTNNQAGYYAIFDESGQPVSQATSNQFTTASGISISIQPQCAYQVRLLVDTNTSTPGTSQIIIDVTYPGMIPVAARRTNTFVTLVKNTDP